MLKLIRLQRFLRLIDKDNKKIAYKDKVLVGFYFDEDIKCISKAEAIAGLRVFSFDADKRRYISSKTCEIAIKNDFVSSYSINGKVYLELNPIKGDDFISGLGILGTLREISNKDRYLISAVLGILTFAIGIYMFNQ